MNRGRSEAIATALHIIPPQLRPKVACDFLVGVDPVFAGLHRYTQTTDGTTVYRDVAHTVYGMHLGHLHAARRRTTVVLLPDSPPWVVVHELGHVLHESLRFHHTAAPVSDYARTNRWEAFAEAFTSWLFAGYGDWPTPATVAFFESL